MSNQYVEKTRGCITASKLKAYILNPMYFYLKYVMEVTPDEEEEDKRHFVVGEAFHYIMENGIDAFLEKYAVGDGLQKSKLATMILEREKENGLEGEEYEKLVKRTNNPKTLLPDLRAKWYGEDYMKNESLKIELTRAEGRDIMGMWEESLKQPQWDMGSYYDKERRIEVVFNTLNVSAQPDRMKFWTMNDKDQEGHPKETTLDQLEALLGELSREEQLKKVEELGIRGVIRDFKTTGDLNRLKYEIDGGDTKYGYMVSMAFYFALIYFLYGIECEVRLDVIEKKAPYVSDVIRLEIPRLRSKFKSVRQRLEEMEQSFIHNYWPEPDREDILNNKDLKAYYKYFSSSIQEKPYNLDLDFSI